MSIPLQVLILEDRGMDAELTIHELKKAGFAVDWQRVDTERDFRARLTPNLDLVIADNSVPGFDALGAIHALRESKLDVPIIVVSGTIREEGAILCLTAGATDYLLKDRLARLGPAVTRALQERDGKREILRAQHALAQSESQMRSVLATMEDVVWSFSLAENRLLYLSPAWERLAGRPLNDYYINIDLWNQSFHPDEREAMLETMTQVLKWGAAEREFRVIRHDGTTRNVVMRAWAAYGPDKKPIRLEGILTDITDKRQAENERAELDASRAAETQMRQQNEFKSQLMNMVAHDLNNLVTPMMFNIEVLAEEGAASREAPGAKAIAGLHDNVDQLQAFLADLLDAARLQSNQLRMDVQPFDLSALVQKSVDSSQPQASVRGVKLRATAPPALVMHGDRRRIGQLVTNLVSNALKFTPEGGDIHLVVSLDGATAGIAISDTGAGIAQEDVAKLFQPFARLGSSPAQGAHTGTGLGLFICRGVVEAHGGTIECESAGADLGTTFRVALPASPRPLLAARSASA